MVRNITKQNEAGKEGAPKPAGRKIIIASIPVVVACTLTAAVLLLRAKEANESKGGMFQKPVPAHCAGVEGGTEDGKVLFGKITGMNRIADAKRRFEAGRNLLERDYEISTEELISYLRCASRMESQEATALLYGMRTGGIRVVDGTPENAERAAQEMAGLARHFALAGRHEDAGRVISVMYSWGDAAKKALVGLANDPVLTANPELRMSLWTYTCGET